MPCGPDRISALETAANIAERWLLKIQSLNKDGEQNLSVERAKTAIGRLQDTLLLAETEYQLTKLKLERVIREANGQPLQIVNLLLVHFCQSDGITDQGEYMFIVELKMDAVC